MSRETLVLSSFWARNGLRESTLCATATVSVLLPLSAACACWGAAPSGMPGTMDPAARARAAAPEATRIRRRERGWAEGGGTLSTMVRDLAS